MQTYSVCNAVMHIRFCFILYYLVMTILYALLVVLVTMYTIAALYDFTI